MKYSWKARIATAIVGLLLINVAIVIGSAPWSAVFGLDGVLLVLISTIPGLLIE